MLETNNRMSSLDGLKEQLRAGFLTVEQVKAASQLGHPLARVLFPREELVKWSENEDRISFLGQFNKSFCVRFSVNTAEKVLCYFESRFRSDNRPRNALEAAQSWLDNPTEDSRRRASDAANRSGLCAVELNDYITRVASSDVFYYYLEVALFVVDAATIAATAAGRSDTSPFRGVASYAASCAGHVASAESLLTVVISAAHSKGAVVGMAAARDCSFTWQKESLVSMILADPAPWCYQ